MPEQIWQPQLSVVKPAGILMATPKDLEGATWDEGTITNGYGRVSGVWVTVQKGTSADINVDFKVSTLSEDSFKQWWQESSSYFNDQQQHTLQEGWGGGGFLGGFLCGGFGLLFGSGNAYHYRNQSDSHWQVTNNQQQGFSKSVYNLDQTWFHITGKLTATGTSYIPVTCTVYVQVTTITFSNGKQLMAIDTENPVAADRNGNTAGTQSGPSKLNLVKIGG